MRIPALLATLFLATPALAEAPATLLPGAMPSLSQGRLAAQRFAPAPVPDPTQLAPRAQRDPNAVQVSPGLTRTHTGRALAGDGFAPGSAYTGELERRGRNAGVGSTLAPSINMRLPVQVQIGSGRP
jgi:hypothetical protein